MSLNPSNICEIVCPAGRVKVEDIEVSEKRKTYGDDNVIVIDNDDDDGTAVLPQVVSITAIDERTVRVLFSKAMPTNTTLGVMAAGNYTASGGGKGTLDVNPGSVTHISNGTLFELYWDDMDEEALGGSSITITVDDSEVRDAGGNLLDPDHASASITAVGDPPTVTELEFLGDQGGGNYAMRVTFSKELNAATVAAGDFTLSGPGKGTLGAHPSSIDTADLAEDHQVLLEWNSGAPVAGQNVTVTVATVADLVGNAIGTPNSATDGVPA